MRPPLALIRTRVARARHHLPAGAEALSLVVDGMPAAAVEALRDDLRRLGHRPSVGEVEEEVDAVARGLLAAHDRAAAPSDIGG